MASPKHLWSGDWERESNQRTPPPVQAPVEPGYRVRPEPDPEPAPAPTPAQASRRRLIAAAIVACLVIVGVVLGATLGSSKHTSPIAQAPQTTPQQPAPFGNSGAGGLYTQTLPQQSTTPSQTAPQQNQAEPNVAVGPTYDWLGMQINVTGDGVTVGSITPGSTADQAGLDPGDVIEAINTAQVASISALQSAVKGLKNGQRFQLIVDRGSTPVTLTATLTGRPVKQ